MLQTNLLLPYYFPLEFEIVWFKKMLKLSDNFKISMCFVCDSMLGNCRLDGTNHTFFQGKKRENVLSLRFSMYPHFSNSFTYNDLFSPQNIF